jgi:hypothetical protein
VKWLKWIISGTPPAHPSPSAPILFSLALDCGRRGILDLEPMIRATRSVRRAEPLRYDPFATELAGIDLLRYQQNDRAAVLCAFDLIEIDGKDLRKAPIEQRKDLLAKIMRPVRRSPPVIALNEHYEGEGAIQRPRGRGNRRRSPRRQ